MNSLRSMDNYDALGEVPRYTVPVSVVNRAFEEMQSVSVIPSGCLWQGVLARMTCEDMSISSSNAGIAKEEVQKIEDLQKRDSLRRLLRSWRERDEEDGGEEQGEALEYLRMELDEDRFSDWKLFP